MSHPPLPLCCSPLCEHWPLPFPLQGVRLLSTAFDPERLDAADFTRWDIPPPRGVAKRQAEFLAGRLCAREALRRLTGAAQVPAVAEDRSPRWPSGVVGSITHGAGWAAAAVARNSQWRSLGLDVEQLLSAPRADRLVQEILTPAERADYSQLPPAQRALRVTLTFSLKESLFKALYPLVNKRFYFEDAELIEHSADGRARLRLLSDLSSEWRRGAELEGQFALLDERLLSLVSVSR